MIARRTKLCLLFVLSAVVTVVAATGHARAQTTAEITARFAHEPDIREVQRASLDASGLQKASDRRWVGRARAAHLLPEVRGEVAWLDQRDIEISYQEDIEADGGAVVTDSRNDYVDDARLRGIYAVRLEWDLSGLVFAPDELDAARAAERRHVIRTELLELVTDAYFERRRWQIEWSLTPATQVRARIEAHLKVQHGTAKLDALTDGWFSTQIGQTNPRRRGGMR